MNQICANCQFFVRGYRYAETVFFDGYCVLQSEVMDDDESCCEFKAVECGGD